MPNLIITKQPDNVCLAASEMNFEVLSNNFKTYDAANNVIDVEFPSTLPVDGDWFEISCDLFSEKFTFSDDPQNDNEISTSYSTFEEFYLMLTQALYLNYYLKDCTFSIAATNTVRFVYHDSSNIAMYISDQDLATGSITYNGSGGHGDVFRSDYRIEASLSILDHEESLIPSIVDYKAKFDFNELLDLKGAFSWPDALGCVSMPDMCKSYKFRAWENIDGVRSNVVNTGLLRVLAGGMSRKELSALADDDSSWWTKYQLTKRFLTNQPSGHVIDLNSTVKLYFLSQASQSIKLKWKVNDDEQSINFVTYNDLDAWTAYELCASPSLIFQFMGEYISDIQKFEIWVEDSSTGTVLSEVRTYYMDWRYQEFRREFIFQNSLGVYDTLRFTGKASYSFAIDSVMSQHNVDKSELNEVRRSRSHLKDSFTVSTGWLQSAVVLDYMQELLHSPEIYEIRNGRLYPVNLVNSKITTREDSVYNYSLDLEFEEAYTEKFYSNIYGTEEGAPIGAGTLVISGGSSSGGHTIISPAGVEMPQRSKLKFTGDAVTVTDDEGNDQTIVTVQSGSEPADKLYMFNNY